MNNFQTGFKFDSCLVGIPFGRFFIFFIFKVSCLVLKGEWSDQDMCVFVCVCFFTVYMCSLSPFFVSLMDKTKLECL